MVNKFFIGNFGDDCYNLPISSSSIQNSEIEANEEDNNCNKQNLSYKQYDPEKKSISINKHRTHFKQIDFNYLRKFKLINQLRTNKQNNKVICSYNETDINLMKYTELTEDEIHILKNFQQQLLLLLHKEKRYLHYFKKSTMLINVSNTKLRSCDETLSVKGDSTRCETSQIESDILNKLSYYKLFSFINIITSYIQPQTYNAIVDRIAALSENVFNLSNLKKSKLSVIENSKNITGLSQFYKVQMEIENQELKDVSKCKGNSSHVYQISDMSLSDLLFKTCQKCCGSIHPHYCCNKEDELFSGLNQIDNETVIKELNPWLYKGSYRTIVSIFKNKNTLNQSRKLICSEKIDKEKKISQENIGMY